MGKTKVFTVVILELLKKTLCVQAESEIQAIEQVKAHYDKAEIILDAEDFSWVQFRVISDKQVKENKR